MTEKRSLGDFGERVARHLVEARGFVIVGRNIRVAAGEIDLLADDPSSGELAFVEVRTRRAGRGSAAATVTPVKLRRMWQCAMEYCEANGRDPELARLDLVTLDLDGAGRVLAIDHLSELELPEA